MERLTDLRRVGAQVRWHALRLAGPWVRQLGWGGVGGGVLLLVSAVLGALALGTAVRQRPLERQLETLPDVDVPVSAAAFDYQVRLAAFDAFLLPTPEIPRVVESLLGLAAAKQLVLKTGEYRLESQPGASFAGYRITLPVVGDAGAVQDFLLSALRRHKTLALESVNFKRQRIESSAVEARVNFVLLTRTTASAGPAPPGSKP